MANPKRKRSKANRDMRRSNWKLKSPGVSSCPQCHQMRVPHRACPHCGYYKGRQVLEVAKPGKK